MGKMGLQLYSVKDAAGDNLLTTIRNASEMGYEGTQFAGFFDYPAKKVKAELDAAGIITADAHVGIDQLVNNIDEVMRFHEVIDNDLIICPFLPESMRTKSDDYYRNAEILNGIGIKMKGAGFRFGYHNHDFEFEADEGKIGFDILYENTDPDYVKMELDCFWAAYAGHDPVQIMDKYSKRLVSLHIKDMKTSGDKKVSTEIGNGELDIQKLIQQGNEHDADWFVVEQEDFTKNPMESAKENAEALRNIIGRGV